MTKTDWVYLVPTGTADIPGVPLVPLRCTPAEADAFLRWSPPAFAVADGPIDGAVRPHPDHVRALREVPEDASPDHSAPGRPAGG
jgi:hypothetical protein